MNLKWVIDGVSDRIPSFPFCISTSQLARQNVHPGAFCTAQGMHAFAPQEMSRETYAVVGLIKQLADVGTALS